MPERTTPTYDGLERHVEQPDTVHEPQRRRRADLELVRGELDALFSSSASTTSNFQYARQRRPAQGQRPGLPSSGSGERPRGISRHAWGGPPPSVQATDDRISIGDTATFLAGAHMIKVGGDYNDTGMDGIFKANWRGIFFFNYPTADRKAGLSQRQVDAIRRVPRARTGSRSIRREGPNRDRRARLLRPGPVVVTSSLTDHGGPEVRAPRQPERRHLST